MNYVRVDSEFKFSKEFEIVEDKGSSKNAERIVTVYADEDRVKSISVFASENRKEFKPVFEPSKEISITEAIVLDKKIDQLLVVVSVGIPLKTPYTGGNMESVMGVSGPEDQLRRLMGDSLYDKMKESASYQTFGDIYVSTIV